MNLVKLVLFIFLCLSMFIIIVVSYSSAMTNYHNALDKPKICVQSCADLGLTYYKWYTDGFAQLTEHCFCLDKENTPIDIGRP